MAVSAFQDYPLADRDREWDGAVYAVPRGIMAAGNVMQASPSRPGRGQLRK